MAERHFAQRARHAYNQLDLLLHNLDHMDDREAKYSVKWRDEEGVETLVRLRLIVEKANKLLEKATEAQTR
jgi:hypothetical protein